MQSVVGYCLFYLRLPNAELVTFILRLFHCSLILVNRMNSYGYLILTLFYTQIHVSDAFGSEKRSILTSYLTPIWLVDFGSVIHSTEKRLCCYACEGL